MAGSLRWRNTRWDRDKYQGKFKFRKKEPEEKSKKKAPLKESDEIIVTQEGRKALEDFKQKKGNNETPE